MATFWNSLFKSATPAAANGELNSWVASAALAASGAFTASSIISVDQARRLTLWVSYTMNASATAGYPQILVAQTAQETLPLTTDDVWYHSQVNDGSVSATLLTGSMPSSVDATIAPEWGSLTLRPVVYRLEGGDASTDKIRLKIPVDVQDARWCFLLYAEEGDSTNPGTFAASYSLSV